MGRQKSQMRRMVRKIAVKNGLTWSNMIKKKLKISKTAWNGSDR